MIWLTLRQLRASAVAVSVVVAAAVVVLAVTGPALVRLHDASPTAFFDRLTGTDTGLYYGGAAAMVVAPALLGIFWGAPLVARELEAGTHRMVWTQSVPRTRWLAVKLGLTALAAVAATGLLSLAVTWWSRPMDGAQSATRGALPSRLTPIIFDARGVAPLGYALFALLVGVSAGLVIRRTLPAMALTLLVLVGVQIAVPLWVRPHLAPPVDRTVVVSRSNLSEVNLGVDGKLTLGARTGDPNSWVQRNETVDSSGRPVALPSWFAQCLPPPPEDPAAQAGPRAAPENTLDQCLTRLAGLGYRQHLVYQPDSNFWRLQWTEAALFTVLSGVLSGCCFWWLRRRLS